MKVLRNTRTNEIYPLNGDLQRAENIEVVDVPDLKKVRQERGNAVLEDAPNLSAAKRRARKKQEPVVEPVVDVESTPANPIGDSDGDDAS